MDASSVRQNVAPLGIGPHGRGVPATAVIDAPILTRSEAADWLVGIHRVDAGGIKGGQPHIADDDDAERGFGERYKAINPSRLRLSAVAR